MKIIGPFKLIAISIIWIAFIFVLSGDDLQQLTRGFDMNLKKFDIQNFIQSGILPVAYLWMGYICLSLLLPAKKA